MGNEFDNIELTSGEKEKKELFDIKKVIQRNKTAALGLAVLLATTNVVFTGCETRQLNPASNSMYMQKLKEKEKDEWDTDFIGGGGDGYFRYSGKPEVSNGHVSSWGAGPGHFSVGGYGVIRGGGAG
ncbi:MAG: hypothetical protein LWY06_09985 [Firmicutes bacterium]|nr:hypothetical protein [Bacillota bacterium]